MKSYSPTHIRTTYVALLCHIINVEKIQPSRYVVGQRTWRLIYQPVTILNTDELITVTISMMDEWSVQQTSRLS
jgi:hypothetical protein